MNIRRLLDTRMIRESLAALLLALVADSIAGYVMNRNLSVFVAIPGLLMVLPALIDMRGNIYGAFISRLSSKLHLGEIKSMKDKEVKEGIHASQFLAFSMALVVGLFAGIYAFYGSGNAFYILLIPAVILLTHVFTTSILTPTAAYLSVKTYEKGWNPDNVGVPLISSIGDLTSVSFLIMSAIFLVYYIIHPTLISIIAAVILGYVVYLGYRSLKSKNGKKVIVQSAPVLMLVAFMELITGGLWEANKIGIILLILPAVLETLGNIGSVFSSRLSSFIYLGMIEPKIVPQGKNFYREVLSIAVLSLIIYTLIAIFVFIVTNSIKGIFLVFGASFLSVVSIILLAYYITVLSLKMKLDPDNIVIPLITTLADIIGTVSIVFVYFLIF